jgi:acetolactate synthase I/II/III large subunit
MASAEIGDGEQQFHGGRLIARRLKAHGVTTLFTLSGGHLFSIYDGCREEGIQMIDVRHEQTAAFAAEGWAKVTREIGVCALTAGPGVTNGMSALGSALMNHSPMLMLGGRAPALRWGQGSLQEIDHVPFVAPLTKFAATADGPGEILPLVDRAIETALAPHCGPTFVDLPMDHVFSLAPEVAVSPARWPAATVSSGDLERVAASLRDAERPVIMAGTDLYWGRGEAALVALAEQLRIPVYVNGLARGCIPGDHELAFSRTRGIALKGADVALVIGVPLDFRLGYGASFGDDCEVVMIDVAEPKRDPPRTPAATLYGALPGTLDGLRAAIGGPLESGPWIRSLREAETAARAGERADFTDPRVPMHPMRVYHELLPLLDRDAIIVGDGGDFVSYAGRIVDSYEPGCWVDPGPYGCLGSGPGYALAAALAHPGRQVVLLQGDGAFGFSGMEFDTLVRHGVSVVSVVGNNGIWALEKYPMEAIYGYSVLTDLQPETRYDQVVEALGGHGELVREPEELRPAFERALAAGGPALINVLTDPAVAYPRRSNLA